MVTIWFYLANSVHQKPLFCIIYQIHLSTEYCFHLPGVVWILQQHCWRFWL